jgi:hypothetical protein
LPTNISIAASSFSGPQRMPVFSRSRESRIYRIPVSSDWGNSHPTFHTPEIQFARAAGRTESITGKQAADSGAHKRIPIAYSIHLPDGGRS